MLEEINKSLDNFDKIQQKMETGYDERMNKLHDDIGYLKGQMNKMD